MALQSGRNGKVMLGATTYNVTGWEFNQEIDILDTTNSASNGYENSITGVAKASGNFKADFPQGDTLPPLGAEVVVQLFDVAGSAICSAKAWIASAPLTSEVKGKVSFSCSFRVNGQWTPPNNLPY